MEGVSGRTSKKQKQKSAKKKGRRSQDEEMDNDDFETESVGSVLSSNGGSTNDEMEDGDSVDTQENQEQLLADAVDRCFEKSVSIKTIAYNDIKKIISRKVLSSFVAARSETMLDLVEKALKRGSNQDRASAGVICSMLCLQLGEEDSKRVFLTLKPLLTNTMQDAAMPTSVRSSCATALGISAFIGASELEDINECLAALKSTFSKKLVSDSVAHDFYSCCVLSWGLLLTVAPMSIQSKDIEENLMLFHRLLEKGELNLRISAGEIIALLFEIGRETRDRFKYNNSDLRGLLKDLATDSSRHKSKRDKKQQRSSFRDISKAVEFGFSPEDIVRFGDEELALSSWARFRQYNALKDILGPGVNAHLQENILVRQMFDLGLPIINSSKITKESKWEKQLYNAASRKERTKSRSKGRENKRMATGL